MKTINYIFCLAVLCSSFKGISQEFSFYLHFQDALGNKDSLLLGHDPTATSGWDAQWGETNIKDQPWDSTFEVRVIPDLYELWHLSDQDFQELDTFNTKVSFSTLGEHESLFGATGFQIAIKAKNYPVQISWNSLLFVDSTLIGSNLNCVTGFASENSDCGRLMDQDSTDSGFLFFSKGSYGSFSPRDEYLNTGNAFHTEDNDTLFCFYVVLGPEGVGVSTSFLKRPELISIYPNPASTLLNIDLPEVGKDVHYQIFDLQGKQIKAGRYNRQIDVSEIRTGLYTLYLYGEDKHYISKFSKL